MPRLTHLDLGADIHQALQLGNEQETEVGAQIGKRQNVTDGERCAVEVSGFSHMMTFFLFQERQFHPGKHQMESGETGAGKNHVLA